ncbi:MAG TPA: methyltransferase domain-containing protein [Pseudolabrys sp.]|nr:methyltransferase domain-containing protein [Pseudolabrys sp.]
MANAPTIFDRRLLRVRRRRARAQGAADFLLTQVADDLAARLSMVMRRFERIVDLGTPGDALRRALGAQLAGPVIRAGDHGTGIAADVGPRVIADEEALPFADGSLDLVVSALALQFLNDLPGALMQIRRALKPDGFFLAAMLGGETLVELRQAFAEAETLIEGGLSPRVAPFADVRQLGGLLQRAGFALPVADSDRLTVRYASPLALMQDLRRMGATNVLAERRTVPLRRETLARAVQVYADNYSGADGRVHATFEVIWLSGWAPHESQQQPLKPGSARHRLADALGAREIPLDDKTGR